MAERESVGERERERVHIMNPHANSVFPQQPEESEPVKRSTRAAAKSASEKMKVSCLSLLVWFLFTPLHWRIHSKSVLEAGAELRAAHSEHTALAELRRWRSVYKFVYTPHCMFITGGTYNWSSTRSLEWIWNILPGHAQQESVQLYYFALTIFGYGVQFSTFLFINEKNQTTRFILSLTDTRWSDSQ